MSSPFTVSADEGFYRVSFLLLGSEAAISGNPTFATFTFKDLLSDTITLQSVTIDLAAGDGSAICNSWDDAANLAKVRFGPIYIAGGSEIVWGVTMDHESDGEWSLLMIVEKLNEGP